MISNGADRIGWTRGEPASAMRVTPGGQASADRDERGRRAVGRALVAHSTAPKGDAGRVIAVPQATVMAQLIAARLHMPQTRRLRRAEPEAAGAVYARAQKPQSIFRPKTLKTV